MSFFTVIAKRMAMQIAPRADGSATIVAPALARARVVANETVAAATLLHDAQRPVLHFMQPTLRAEVSLLAPGTLEATPHVHILGPEGLLAPLARNAVAASAPK